MKRFGVAGLWIGAGLLAPELARAEAVGSWVVACAEGAGCDVRHRMWLAAPAGGRPFAALEIRMRHGFAVPVVAAHGVAVPEAAGTLLALAAEASLQFGTEKPIPLPCVFAGDSIACAPARADEAAASERLKAVKTARIRLHFSEAAGLALPDQARSLELAGTAEAAGRLDAGGAAADARWDLRDLLDALARQFGFPGGLDEWVRWLFGRFAKG
jgi:hypothetical protein